MWETIEGIINFVTNLNGKADLHRHEHLYKEQSWYISLGNVDFVGIVFNISIFFKVFALAARFSGNCLGL
jgi:hypothetical protein